MFEVSATLHWNLDDRGAQEETSLLRKGLEFLSRSNLSSPLADLSQSTLQDSNRSGSVMVLPGSVFLKKATSSSVTAEKGSLAGTPAEDILEPSAPVLCSFLGVSPGCHEVPGRTSLQGLTVESLSVAAREKVQCGLRHWSTALRLTALWRIITMTGVTVCRAQQWLQIEDKLSTRRELLSSVQNIFYIHCRLNVNCGFNYIASTLFFT